MFEGKECLQRNTVSQSILESLLPNHEDEYQNSTLANSSCLVVVISHLDADHFNLINEIFRRLPHATWREHFSRFRVYVGGRRSWETHLPEALRALCPITFPLEDGTRDVTLSDRNLGTLTLEFVDRGDRPAATLPLDASDAKGELRNATSLVGLLKYGRSRILLTGDATSQQLLRVSAAVNRLDIFLVPHHGARPPSASKTYNATEVLRRFRLCNAIISAGKHNGYCHPSQEVVDDVEQHQPKLKVVNSNFPNQ